MTPIERDAALKDFAAGLRERFGIRALTAPIRVRSTNYVQPPLECAERGDKLHLARHPGINLDGDGALMLFESAVEVLLGRCDDPEVTLATTIDNGSVTKLIRGVEPLEPKLATLLWYLSKAKGVEVERGASTFLLHTNAGTVGVADGKLVSSFFSDAVLSPFDTDKLLSRSMGLCRATEPSFIHAYALAKRADIRVGPLTEGVAILYQATTPQLFRQLLTSDLTLSKAMCSKLEETVLEGRDPLLRVYKTLVPRWVSKSDFYRNFGSLTGRDVNPDILQRQVLLNKVASQPFYP